MKPKEKKLIVILIIAMILIISSLYFVKQNTEGKQKVTEGEIETLKDIFPNKEGIKIEYKEGDKIYKAKVDKIEEKGEKREVTMSYMDGKTTIEKIYEIQTKKVIEKGRILEDGKEVSVIYPLEIIVGMPYQGSVWKSVDGKTTNRVTKIEKEKIVIESTRETETIENESTVSKNLKETRTYEKGKGLTSYQTELK